MRALMISVSKTPVLIVRRSSRWKRKMVYILLSNRSHKYRSGKRSRIIYIGTTRKGGRRPATSAVEKASDAFNELHGVKEIEVQIASCRGRKRMETWKYLESALLAMFRELHFELPKYNKKKGSFRDTDEIKLFRRAALKKLILEFAG